MKEAKKYIIIIITIVLVLTAAIAALVIHRGRLEAEREKNQGAQVGITAMYVNEDHELFVALDDKGLFSFNFPKKIYGVNGEEISRSQLEEGDIVVVYGNGSMSTSYPGMYNDVTKIEVIEEGKPSDADQYQYLIDRLYP